MGNTRFYNKALKTDPAHLEAILSFYKGGGSIKVVSSSKRPRRGYTLGGTKKK